jgi:RNA polymerase sigma-70 factor, ECF subfamily
MTPTPDGPDAGAHGDVDDSVLAQARAGDEHAFSRLYLDLAPRLRRYAASLVGDDADDVSAEAWLQIARDIRSFDGDLDGLRGWTARIVRNRAMDLLRYRARRPAVSTPVEELFDLAAHDDTEAGALELIGTDHAIELIASLPREQAEAVMLRAVVGLDAATAGRVLDKSATAVRVAAHRGLKKLARTLARTEVKRHDADQR